MPTSFKTAFIAAKEKAVRYKERQTHHSFRVTRRRDYQRRLQLPGLWEFTLSVNKLLWKQRKVFIVLVVVYALLSGLLVGIGSQSSYVQASELIGQTGQQAFDGDWSQLTSAGILFASIATTGLNQTPSEGQQIYAALLGLLVWLTAVWLLRAILAGHQVRVRDGLYQAGAPIVPTLLIGLVLVVQLLPLALAVLAYSAASASGLLASGVEAMLFWFAAALLAVMSLYWMTSTFLAAVIVTLPGMYPWKALRAAGEIVMGRRLRILSRILWMFLWVAISWAIILIPFIVLDTWLRSVWDALQAVPVIPVVILLLSTASVVWVASYIYLLYRKIVDEDAHDA